MADKELLVYISGGPGRQSVVDEHGHVLSKATIRTMFRKSKKYVIQKGANLSTDIVVIPDHVTTPSDSTRRKVRSGVRIMTWSQFKDLAFGASRRRGGATRRLLHHVGGSTLLRSPSRSLRNDRHEFCTCVSRFRR
jgi:hypothetical protein